jgi:hypothetical protein
MALLARRSNCILPDILKDNSFALQQTNNKEIFMSEQCNCASNQNDTPQEIHSFPLSTANDLKRQARQYAVQATGIRASALAADGDDDDRATLLTTNDGSLFLSASVDHGTATMAGAASGSVAVLGTTSTGVSALALSNVTYDEKTRELTLKLAGVVGNTPVDQAVRIKLNENSAAFVPAGDIGSGNPGALGFPSPICVFGCGGSAILPLVVSNLPLLVTGGPAAYIAALIAAAPTRLIGAINCIRDRCL